MVGQVVFAMAFAITINDLFQEAVVEQPLFHIYVV